MTTTIVSGSDIITPLDVIDYQSERESGNIVHRVINRQNADITLRPSQLRQGTLELIFTDENASLTALNIIATAGVMQVLDSDVPSIEMSFIASGRTSRTIDPSRVVWVLSIDYQEVSA